MSGLGEFKTEDFETVKDVFHNLLYQKTGVTKADLRYVIRNRFVLKVFLDVATEKMYQIRISGESFSEDNWTVFWMLKEYLITSPGWAWIERFNAIENGCEEF